MAAERFIACRQILFGVGAEIAERGREAVASVLLGNPAQRPQGVLQSFRQCDKTFTAEHDVGVLEAGEGQTEVIEPAVQQLASDGDAEIGDLGEVRQPHAAGRMLLAEDHLSIRPIHCSPRPNPALKRPPGPGSQFRVPTA